jgi:hypothetical protein
MRQIAAIEKSGAWTQPETADPFSLDALGG